MNPQNREDIKIGQEVEVVLKADQRTGEFMCGIVTEILLLNNSIELFNREADKKLRK